MKSTTLSVLRRTYQQLQNLVDQLYVAAQAALDNEDFSDASLLESAADKLYVEAENLDILISELEEQ
ncbi:hypothetical protein NIES4072_68090 [Nostoc commune NIES-4072]|uniref:Uncharacterized protein n=1 Tax=Nostoc commune NIES-4072 TaxID=2005467 RepID=A0A2R5FWJ3_NOSCO|nr:MULTISPECIES: hypothetical protein [Nostoc]MCC5670295.1 hypothetical protein [Nostoc mirabile CHAB5784]BBD70443.1 hypothetical protein NIES4070_68540 [Nostoc commune HK-02]GBG23097.1 hypothetical protein NIES4072_68090 [Nostoc commune NIES-4072]